MELKGGRASSVKGGDHNLAFFCSKSSYHVFSDIEVSIAHP